MRKFVAQQSLLTQTCSQDKYPKGATEANVGKKKMSSKIKKETKGGYKQQERHDDKWSVALAVAMLPLAMDTVYWLCEQHAMRTCNISNVTLAVQDRRAASQRKLLFFIKPSSVDKQFEIQCLLAIIDFVEVLLLFVI